MSKNERIAALEAQLRAQQDEIAALRQRIEALEARPYIEFAPAESAKFPTGSILPVEIESAMLAAPYGVSGGEWKGQAQE